jgi:short-subunit dehydrogenase involved in D-alanine esterification of teichoic acids
MGKLTFSQLWNDQRGRVPPPVIADLTGKTVLVVGANTGIGLEATKHFTKMGAARVILGARNSEKSERALEGAFDLYSYLSTKLY